MRNRSTTLLFLAAVAAMSALGISQRARAVTQRELCATAKRNADAAVELDKRAEFLNLFAETHYSIDPQIACGYARQARVEATRHNRRGLEAQALNQLARCAIDSFDFRRADDLLERAHTLAASEGDNRAIARNNIFRAQLALRSREGGLAESIESLDAAFTLAEEIEDPSTQIEALLVESELYYAFRDRQLYLEALGLAAQLATTSAVPEWSYVPAFHLAAVASADGDRNEQLRQYKNVCGRLRSEGMTWRWAYFVTNLARTQRALGKLDEALESLALSAEGFALTSTGRHYSLDKQFGRYYQAIGDWDSARSHYRTLLETHERWENAVGQIENLRALAEVEIAAHDVDTAVSLLGQALQIANNIDDSYRQRSIVLELARIDESMGNPAQAYAKMATANTLSIKHEKDLVENAKAKMNGRLRALELRSQKRVLLAENKTRETQTIVLAFAFLLACAVVGASLYYARTLGKQKAQLSIQGGQLRDARDRFDQLHGEKVDLIKILAHDMRGAVTEIVLTSEVMGSQLRGGNLDGIRELSGRFAQMASRLKNQLEKLLSWAQSSEDSSIMRSDEIDLAGIAEECADDLAPVLSNKGLKLETQFETCPAVPADPDAVRVIINNLVLNAYKYSRRGAVVELRVRQVADAVEIWVRDFGSGMDSKQLGIVRSRSPLESKPGTDSELGLGVGLSLVRRLTDRMGAELRIESSPGQGTVAVVRFSRGQSRQAAA